MVSDETFPEMSPSRVMARVLLVILVTLAFIWIIRDPLVDRAASFVQVP